MAFIHTMPGVPTLYYGDEIGMRNTNGLVSKEGGYVRTGARTPMQWDNSRNLGFSEADSSDLYLPVDAAEHAPTVQQQDEDPDSLLNLTRQLTKLRSQLTPLSGSGDFQPLHVSKGGYPFVFVRNCDEETVLVAINPMQAATTCEVENQPCLRKLTKLKLGEGEKVVDATMETLCIKLPPLSFAIWA
jgi:maltose alpha-D-glucosyltransferase/alpha-amylase